MELSCGSVPCSPVVPPMLRPKEQKSCRLLLLLTSGLAERKHDAGLRIVLAAEDMLPGGRLELFIAQVNSVHNDFGRL